LTKHLHDEALKCNLTVEDTKVEMIPKLIDNSLVIYSVQSQIASKPEDNLKIKLVKPKMNAKRSRLAKATQQLYNLEAGNAQEKTLSVDLDLYQMENF
jgi:hypothetical protein